MNHLSAYLYAESVSNKSAQEWLCTKKCFRGNLSRHSSRQTAIGQISIILENLTKYLANPIAK